MQNLKISINEKAFVGFEMSGYALKHQGFYKSGVDGSLNDTDDPVTFSIDDDYCFGTVVEDAGGCGLGLKIDDEELVATKYTSASKEFVATRGVKATTKRAMGSM